MSDPENETVPAPWTLKGRAWAFAVPPLSKSASFPAGWSAPWQADAMAQGGEFIGGPGLVQIFSYAESPVGPYDELIYLPGKWKYADGSKGFRITRIYVSSKSSMYNGRKNWNIPKQFASFDYHETDAGVWSLSVTTPGSETPFFKVTVHPIPLLSAISFPFKSSILGSFIALVQPPVPKGELNEEAETSEWCSMIPVMTGGCRMLRIEPEIESAGGKKTVGDGIGYPAVAPYRYGFALEGLGLDFGFPNWLNDFKA
ncbi:hypothetical protein C8J56DRAFT_339912 [Mycena floridula]|nr:hypothetical protein C8J56DRAFT_339912 [Mycena floridula]